MYKRDIYTILSNEPLTPAVYLMVLEGDTQYITRSGQFINIELEGKFLRRPISVSDYDQKSITIIYNNFFTIGIALLFVYMIDNNRPRC